MKKKEMNKLLDHIKGAPLGQAVQQFVDNMIDELDSVSGVDSVDEVMGRQHAIEKLKRLKNRLDKDESKEEKGSEYE